MIAAPRSDGAPSRSLRRSRWSVKAGALGLASAALVGSGLGAAPAAANPLWGRVTWAAPVSTSGPNLFDVTPELRGTAAPLLPGNPNRVDYPVTAPEGHPGGCAVPAGTAALQGRSFAFTPAIRCNGTYAVAVVARTGSGLLASSSDPLRATVAVADPGPAPSGLGGGVDAATGRASITWNADPDPDVVGYRVRRDGVPVADVGAGTRSFSDAVPGPGRYAFDVQTLRWGAGGPGSPSIASAPSAPLAATYEPPVAPPGGGGADGPGSPGGSPGAGSGLGTGGSGGNGGSGVAGPGTGTAPGGGLPGIGTASPSLPGGSTSRSGGATYRSGGTISRSTPTAEDDTYEERLPYEARETSRAVELVNPDTTRTVARTVTTPGHERPGLLVPAAVALVLVATSLQIRAFLRRTQPAALSVLTGPIPPEG